MIRPTGLLDPRVEVRPVTGQIDDLMEEINARAARDERVLVTTLTKKMAEDLTEYFKNAGIKDMARTWGRVTWLSSTNSTKSSGKKSSRVMGAEPWGRCL